MKTYTFKQSLSRIHNLTAVSFEKFMLQNKWFVFDSEGITDSVIFHPNHIFEVNSQRKISFGQWKYFNEDYFELNINDACYGLHLVHFDNNLMVYELHDTKQYFILLSQQGMNTFSFISLEHIEYYIKRHKVQVYRHAPHTTITDFISQ